LSLMTAMPAARAATPGMGRQMDCGLSRAIARGQRQLAALSFPGACSRRLLSVRAIL